VTAAGGGGKGAERVAAVGGQLPPGTATGAVSLKPD